MGWSPSAPFGEFCACPSLPASAINQQGNSSRNGPVDYTLRMIYILWKTLGRLKPLRYSEPLLRPRRTSQYATRTSFNFLRCGDKKKRSWNATTYSRETRLLNAEAAVQRNAKPRFGNIHPSCIAHVNSCTAIGVPYQTIGFSLHK